MDRDAPFNYSQVNMEIKKNPLKIKIFLWYLQWGVQRTISLKRIGIATIIVTKFD
jgi:hypothetical protein